MVSHGASQPVGALSSPNSAFPTFFAHQTRFVHISNVLNPLKECSMEHALRDTAPDPGPGGSLASALSLFSFGSQLHSLLRPMPGPGQASEGLWSPAVLVPVPGTRPLMPTPHI